MPKPKQPKGKCKALRQRQIRQDTDQLGGEVGGGAVKGSKNNGGGLGIRTLGTREGSAVFKTAAIDHSANPPSSRNKIFDQLVSVPASIARLSVSVYCLKR